MPTNSSTWRVASGNEKPRPPRPLISRYLISADRSLPREESRGLAQDLALLAQLAYLAAQRGRLGPLRTAHRIRICATQVRIDCAVGSNSLAGCSGERLAHTSSTICRRNSGGYDGRVLGTVDSCRGPSPPSTQMSTTPGQLQVNTWVPLRVPRALRSARTAAQRRGPARAGRRA